MFKAFQNFSIAARSEAKCRRTIISSRYSIDADGVAGAGCSDAVAMGTCQVRGRNSAVEVFSLNRHPVAQ